MRSEIADLYLEHAQFRNAPRPSGIVLTQFASWEISLMQDRSVIVNRGGRASVHDVGASSKIGAALGCLTTPLGVSPGWV
jgi:hypothetical protein